MIAVLDSNVAIGLAKGECLEHIRTLFLRVVIPPAVRREVIEEAHGRVGGRELEAAVGVWIHETAPAGIGDGAAIPGVSTEDRQVLALAAELGAVVLSDDAVLRREADRLGISALGVVEIVLLLKYQGILPAIKPILDLMQARTYCIDPTIYAQALEIASERH
jgi:predicted nucleic acid-binding protein